MADKKQVDKHEEEDHALETLKVKGREFNIQDVVNFEKASWVIVGIPNKTEVIVADVGNSTRRTLQIADLDPE